MKIGQLYSTSVPTWRLMKNFLDLVRKLLGPAAGRGQVSELVLARPINPQPSRDLPQVPRNIQHGVAQIRASTNVPFLIESMGSGVGHWRQAAIQRSAALQAPELFRAVVERLNDWVPQVRDEARITVMALLPIMSPRDVIAALPTILKLQTAHRSDHSDYLRTFKLELLATIPPAALMGGLNSDSVHVTRATFTILKDAPSVDIPTLLRLTLTQRGDIVAARQAAWMIDQLPPRNSSRITS